MRVATCYELREVWGFGCPDPYCELRRLRPPPQPCVRNASALVVAREKPLPPENAPILSPCGHVDEDPRRGKKKESN